MHMLNRFSYLPTFHNQLMAPAGNVGNGDKMSSFPASTGLTPLLPQHDSGGVQVSMFRLMRDVQTCAPEATSSKPMVNFIDLHLYTCLNMLQNADYSLIILLSM